MSTLHVDLKDLAAFFTLASGVLLSVYVTVFLSLFSQDDKIQKTLKLVADWQLAHMAAGPSHRLGGNWLGAGVVLYWVGSLSRDVE